MSFTIANTGYWSGEVKEHHTCCIELCNWIIDYFKDQKEIPVYDFGCGVGQYSKKIADAGYDVYGFEGKVPEQKEYSKIREQDLTKPFSILQKGNCVFLEVAEHVPAQYENILLQNISDACHNKLVMSWAVRGQSGHGHVNCLNNDEAIIKMTNKGFIFLPEETESARKSISQNTAYPWFLNTTLIFKKGI